jgi:phosphoribosylamine--glycine ligase
LARGLLTLNILVIGGGGREHALCWKLRQSPQVKRIWCAPGNGGIAQDAECVPGDPKDVAGLLKLAQTLKADLTVAGPELPLVNGIVDEFEKAGLAIIGPPAQGARLEGSKIFAKEFLNRHKIPTAPAYGWHDSVGAAYSALCAVDWPMVIKADGLCAGKGVLVAHDPDEATAFLERLMEKSEFGPGGNMVLLEEALEGQELSYIVLTDGNSYVPMCPTRDYKRLLDGDKGPNTGGMGAFSADVLVSPALDATIRQTIIEPTLRGLARDGIPYRGFLYFGLMLTASGPMVLEFNCRLGDPETEAIVVRMDFDLAGVLRDLATGKLDPSKVRWKPGASACVVVASAGYPSEVKAGKEIAGLADTTSHGQGVVFHAGTKQVGGKYYNYGGRVLVISVAAESVSAATGHCYHICSNISFDGMHYRKDIGASFAKAAGS